uniref:Fibrous sheath-interacting protein 1 n=1 Tax=Caenorhabditis tropicalis TaxID=1561998 RepID=A0A1I7UAF9_9PELO
MSADCKTTPLVNSETPGCSPVYSMGENKTHTLVAVTASENSQKTPVIPVAMSETIKDGQAGACSSEKLGKIGMNEEGGQQEKKKRHSKKPTSRLFIGYHSTGQRVFLTNCPMRSSAEDSSTESETES